MKEEIRKWKVIHLAISLGVVILSTIAYFYHQSMGNILDASNHTFEWEYGTLLSLLFILLIGQWIHRRKLVELRTGEDLTQTIKEYRKALIILFAGIEAGSIISLSAFVLTGFNNLFLYNMIFVVYLLYNRPNPMKVINDLKLTGSDGEEVRKAFT